ncbi:TGF-beta receptor type-2-like [Oculina patagonica]
MSFFQILCAVGNFTKDSSKRKEKESITVIQSKESNNASTIVWISLAAVLLPLLIAGLINRLRRCNDHFETKLVEVVEDSALGETYSEKIIQDAEQSKSVVLETMLSQGRYASVWKGRVMDQLVAVKIFPVTAFASWQKERDIYDLLSVEHSNVTKLIPWNEAGDRENDPLWLIMDYCENGSLRDYLRQKMLSWSEAGVLASGITSGVAFLHSEHVQAGGKMKVAVAHRDLKSTNILVRKDGTSVITDFGLAVSLKSVEDERNNIQVGTYRYMSPEELLSTVDLDSTEAFKQMDIYSMALVLWEIISRCKVADARPDEYQLPYAEMVGPDVTLNNMVEVVALKQCRPRLPSTDHEGLKVVCQTVQECWDPDPEARLTADCTKLRLKELLLMT